MTELLIKNMVCQHCKQAVRRLLGEMGFSEINVELGKAAISEALSDERRKELEEALNEQGFELLTDPETQLIEKAKHLIMRHIREEEGGGHSHNLSECIERNLNVSYDTVSRIFSQREGRTLEKYHIAQKIERVKELLQHDQYTLSEIADMVDYSSVAHLSRQFKSVTGMTPTEYLRGPRERKDLNNI
ncbi:MAG: helix-turn-helix domain-containing protein [Duncaniella sp.]|nr:helix-turn-helix domain-containing protein [Bacteroides sp.]MBD5318531.1 helix-turn-helix domain-containing protein [Bacteroides sp.]MBD5353806.1 helix-turn-helix domain-containing protein [Bacteroides sp.]MDE7475648.1 helix-turn-helix domain-containing protein [Duncaniella sp.]